MNVSPVFPDALQGALREALSMVLPIRCAGCGVPDENLCLLCQQTLAPHVQYRELFDDQYLTRIPLWYSVELSEVLSSCLHLFKDSGRTSLKSFLATPARAGLEAAQECLTLSDLNVVWVVPPSSRANFRKRGYVPTVVLAKTLGIRPQPLVGIRRRRVDQSGLGRMERLWNMRGVYKPKRNLTGVNVMIFDDVLTTGATLLECARALREGGARVLGAVVLAYTPKNFQDTCRINA